MTVEGATHVGCGRMALSSAGGRTALATHHRRIRGFSLWRIPDRSLHYLYWLGSSPPKSTLTSIVRNTVPAGVLALPLTKPPPTETPAHFAVLTAFAHPGLFLCWGARHSGQECHFIQNPTLPMYGYDILTSLARPSLPGRRQPVQVPRLRFRVRRPIAAW